MKQLIPFIIAFFWIPLFSAAQAGLEKDSTILQKTRLLETVTVDSKRPFVTQQIDRTVLNIQNNPLAASGNVLEALQQAPGVSVINDETISMSGKQGVNVYIDGRPTQLSGKDLAVYLKSMQAGTVDKIELISNPSAAFDAQGNAGIINIRMKKSLVRGANGNLASSYTFREHHDYNISGNLNYRLRKLNLYANASYNDALQHTTGNITRTLRYNGTEKIFLNNTTDIDRSHKMNIMAGADLFIDPYQTLGFMVKTGNNINPMLTPGTTAILSAGKIDSSLITLNDNKSDRYNNNYNIHYRFADTAGTGLNIDADIIDYRNTNASIISATLLNYQQVPYGNSYNDQQVNTRILITNLKADLSKTFRSIAVKMDAGIKLNSSKTNNDITATRLLNNTMQKDTGKTNRFDYHEKIMAAYVNFSKEIRRWAFQAGLRAEHTSAKGVNTDLENNMRYNPDTAYSTLFPSLFIQFKPTGNTSYGISYSRRINRPTYQDLNPFEYQYDNYSSYAGNPYLQPEFSNNIELMANFKNGLNSKLGASYTNQFFQDVLTQQQQLSVSTVQNVGKQQRYYLNLGYAKSFTKWWSSYNNVVPFYETYHGNIPSGKVSQSSAGMSWYSNQGFQLSPKYSLQLSTWGNVRTRNAQYKTKGLGSVDLSAGRSFMKKKLGIKIAVLDIFNTQRWSQTASLPDLQYAYNRKWESRGVRCAVTWKFGKTSFSRPDRNNAVEEEANRIKN